MGRADDGMKCMEVRSLLKKGAYQDAFEVAETIDLNRVKSIVDLKVIASVYERLGEYEMAKDVLLRSYEKKRTKMVVYRLAYLSIKTGEFEDAEALYQEFSQMAPDSPDRYILRYGIDRAKNVDYVLRIATLQKLKNIEYTEEWGYELAKIYHKAGLHEECIRECKDLIIWFGQGVIVDKARLLCKYHEEGRESLDAYGVFEDNLSPEEQVERRERFERETADFAVQAEQLQEQEREQELKKMIDMDFERTVDLRQVMKEQGEDFDLFSQEVHRVWGRTSEEPVQPEAVMEQTEPQPVQSYGYGMQEDTENMLADSVAQVMDEPQEESYWTQMEEILPDEEPVTEFADPEAAFYGQEPFAEEFSQQEAEFGEEFMEPDVSGEAEYPEEEPLPEEAVQEDSHVAELAEEMAEDAVSDLTQEISDAEDTQQAEESMTEWDYVQAARKHIGMETKQAEDVEAEEEKEQKPLNRRERRNARRAAKREKRKKLAQEREQKVAPDEKEQEKLQEETLENTVSDVFVDTRVTEDHPEVVVWEDELASQVQAAMHETEVSVEDVEPQEPTKVLEPVSPEDVKEATEDSLEVQEAVEDTEATEEVVEQPDTADEQLEPAADTETVSEDRTEKAEVSDLPEEMEVQEDTAEEQKQAERQEEPESQPEPEEPQKEEASENASLESGSDFVDTYGMMLWEYFEKYQTDTRLCEDVYVALERAMKRKQPLNFIITCKRSERAVDLAKDIAKALKSLGLVQKQQVARITADKLNRMHLEQKYDEVAGGFLLVEGAKNMTPDTVQSILNMMEELKENIVVILCDARPYMMDLMGQYSMMKRYFSYDIAMK